MRKFLIAIIALAFVSSTAFPAAFAQDKAGATSSDTMSKDTMKKHTKKPKKSAKKSSSTMTKQQ